MSNALRWVQHPDLSRIEELLVHIANLRMPTASQLAALMGIKKESVVKNICLLNKEEKQTIRAMKLRGVNSEKVYWLGKRACELVSETTGEKVPYYEFSRRKGQSRHTKGLNDILIRLIKAGGIDQVKKYCTWWTTKGAKQEIFDLWQIMEQWDHETAKEEFKTMLSPDARFRAANQHYWVEYDNDTKERGAIWEQYELYICKLLPINNNDPVIWVAKDATRRDELKKWWELYKQNPPITPELQDVIARIESRGEQLRLPEMHFFAPGEETKPLLTGRL